MTEKAEGSSTPSAYMLDPRMQGFISRLLMMEHFTMHRTAMAMQDYSFCTFKEVEQQILSANVATDSVSIIQSTAALQEPPKEIWPS